MVAIAGPASAMTRAVGATAGSVCARHTVVGAGDTTVTALNTVVKAEDAAVEGRLVAERAAKDDDGIDGDIVDAIVSIALGWLALP